MEMVLHSESEIANCIFLFPTSTIEENGKKINYFQYISSHKNLEKVYARIDLDKINKIIADTPTCRKWAWGCDFEMLPVSK